MDEFDGLRGIDMDAFRFINSKILEITLMKLTIHLHLLKWLG